MPLNTANRLIALLASVAIFSFFFLILVLRKSYGPAAIGLLLAASGFLCVNRLAPLSAETKRLLLYVFAYPLVLLVVSGLRFSNLSGLDYQLLALAILPILLVSSRLILEFRSLYWGLVLGCIGASIFGAKQVYIDHLSRAGSYITNEIPYGQIAAILSALTLCMIANGVAKRWRILAGIAALFGIAALILSGTRGALLGILVWFGFYLWLRINQSLKVKCLALALMLLLVFASLSLTGLGARVLSAKSEIAEFRQGNTQTSVGIRFELWRASTELFLANPLLGVGHDAFQSALKQKAEQKEISSLAAIYTHPHSQYFDTLARHGLLGFSLLLLSFIGPYSLFLTRFKSSVGQAKIAALAGMSLIVITMVCNLTQPLYAHSISVIFYFVTLAVCWLFSSPYYSKHLAD